MATERSARRRRGPVELATARDIARLPKPIRDGALAACALDLARRQDQAPVESAAAGMSASSLARELRMVLVELGRLAPEAPALDGVDALAARRAARRGA